MTSNANNQSEDARLSRGIPDLRKKAILLKLSEDEFRDRVVRPLYRRLGLQHLRDTCGATEEGKDCLWQSLDAFGDLNVVAVQTKRGAITQSSKPGDNVHVAITQLKTALDVPVHVSGLRAKVRPSEAHLCASGGISNSARQYIIEQLGSPRIKVLGADELIELVDKHIPELWLGIDANRLPYVRALRKRLIAATDTIRLKEIAGDDAASSPVTDSNYVNLRLSRLESKVIKHRGETTTEARFVHVSLESVLSHKQNLILITAEGGAGKTTALRRLALGLAEQALQEPDAAPIPVMLRAKDIVATGRMSSVTIEATNCPETGECAVSSADLERGRVVLLIDGLDEVSEDARGPLLSRLSEFHAEFQSCKVIVTARDYRSILELPDVSRFAHYLLMPMTTADALRLADKIASERSVDRQLLRSTIRKLHEVHGLALSPMMVTVFLASPDFSRQDIPPNIAEIFKKVTEQMLGRWDERKGLKQQFEANIKDFLLRRLAFEMHRNRRRSVSLKEVEDLFCQELLRREMPIDSDLIFNEILYRSGLLRIDDGQVEWRHHLLQEFFAGRGVPDADFFCEVVDDEWWRAPMVFYFGQSGEALEELERIRIRAELLEPSRVFEAAIAIGLSLQACYLAETTAKTRMLAWVVQSLARGMDAFRAACTGGAPDRSILSLCVALALGRDGVGTRTIAKIRADFASDANEGSLSPAAEDKLVLWRLVGLLEAGELAVAIREIKKFRTSDPEVLFMLHLSIAWALHVHPVSGTQQTDLERLYQRDCGVLEPQRQALFKELRSLLFEFQAGSLKPVRSHALGKKRRLKSSR